jgi:hypothetical protein
MLAKIDGRTKESRLMAAARAELTRHVGGSPSSVQKALIERLAREENCPGTGRFQPGLASWRRMFRIWGLLLALALCASLAFFLIEVWQIVEFINR